MVWKHSLLIEQPEADDILELNNRLECFLASYAPSGPQGDEIHSLLSRSYILTQKLKKIFEE